MRRLSLPLALGLALAPAAAGAAGLMLLPTQDGVAMWNAVDLSGDGHVVVGTCTIDGGGGAPCRWREGVGYELLEEPAGGFAEVVAVSHDGSVVAGQRGTNAEPGVRHPVRWGVDGQLEEIAEAPGAELTETWDVSADGNVIVGTTQVPATPGEPRPFRWTAAGGMELLDFIGWAYAVSGDGKVVVGLYKGIPAPFYWSEDFGVAPIWELNGNDSASGVSPDGYVVTGGAIDGSFTQGWVSLEDSGPVPLGGEDLLFGLHMHDASLIDYQTVVGVSGLWEGEGYVYTWDRGLRTVKHALVELQVDMSAWSEIRNTTSVSADGRRILGMATPVGGGPSVPAIANLAPACDDGLDNDGDGAVDMADAQCLSPTQIAERRCGLGFELAFVIPPIALARRRMRRR